MNEELLERFREDFAKQGSDGNRYVVVDDTRKMEEWLTTHTLSKKEVARVIEEAQVYKVNVSMEMEPAHIHTIDKDDLLEALNLTEK